MATHIIPTPPVGRYRWLLRREFEGTFYRLMFRWNVRAGAWVVDFGNDSNIAQVRGMKMNLRQDILGPYKHKEVPPGTLSVVDSSGEDREPTLEDFGGRVMLEYTDSEDTAQPIPEPNPPPVPD